LSDHLTWKPPLDASAGALGGRAGAKRTPRAARTCQRVRRGVPRQGREAGKVQHSSAAQRHWKRKTAVSRF